MKLITFAPAVVLSLALGAGACQNSNNNAKDRVEKALDQAKVEGVNVDYDRNAGVVHLKGKVDSTEHKQQAERIAEQAVGTSGKVLNELTVEGTDTDRLDSVDDQLKTRLNDSIQAHPQLSKDSIDFYVNNGIVTVTGEVKSAAQKAEVSRIVKETPGVKDFANELRLDTKNGRADRTDQGGREHPRR